MVLDHEDAKGLKSTKRDDGRRSDGYSPRNFALRGFDSLRIAVIQNTAPLPFA